MSKFYVVAVMRILLLLMIQLLVMESALAQSSAFDKSVMPVSPMSVIHLNNNANKYTDTNAGNTIYGMGGNDTIYGRGGNDKLTGDDGNDKLYGEDGNDQLYGGYGADLLSGGKGDDTLIGGFGNDRYIGGSGRDIFTSVSIDSNIPGADVVDDFVKGQDKIRVAPQVSWSRDLDTNHNGYLDNGDSFVVVSGMLTTINMSAASGYIDELDTLSIRSNGALTKLDFIY